MAGNNTKRRPMGLKSSMSKKPKTDENESVVDSSQMINDYEDERTATIALKSKDGASDDFEDLEEIYNNAMEALESDQEQAILLFQGAIHDCDRIIKIKDSENQILSLPTIFYYIYGMSLFKLSELLDPEDSVEYLKLASQRLNQALDSTNNFKNIASDILLSSKINIGIGKCDLSLSRLSEESMNLKHVDPCLSKFSIAIESHLKSNIHRKVPNDPKKDADSDSGDINKNTNIDQIYSVIDMVLTFAVISHDFDLKLHCISWSKNSLDLLKNDLFDPERLFFLAKADWILAQHYLDSLDTGSEEDSDVDDDEDEEFEEKNKISAFNDPEYESNSTRATEYLSSAERILTEIFEKEGEKSQPEVFTMLGEVLLNKGNFISDNKEQESYYKKSAKMFNLAQKVSGDDSIVPEHLLEFLQDYQ
ncbi:Enhancer of translation termination 1 [Smittium culicis]|uniref:Enhancer of translation termination 1 n=1 Tax=Smittium culicis TaxID=133412 RepID=A0A1R1YLK1_9FUNG|nr:Enhancer of translation termination 1 [Smittium culicis]